VTAQTKVLPRTGPKPLVMAGMGLGVIAMIVFTRLTPASSYVSGIFPGLLIIGLGMGCIFAPAIGTATLGVDVHETGVASAMVNTSQQVGGSVGLALLSTLSASAASAYATSHAHLRGLAAASGDPWLYDSVHVDRRNLCAWPAPGAPHPALEDRAPRLHSEDRASPTESPTHTTTSSQRIPRP